MKKGSYYSSGDFAKKAHVTKKTLRYYDAHNLLPPSYVSESGARFYTDNDFARLQQILFLKYLSFSLADIKEMTVRNGDRGFWEESLRMQSRLVAQQMEQLSLMQTALQEAQSAVSDGAEVDWSRMLELVNRNELEETMKRQYLNSSNISARITLHRAYAQNPQGWFPWLYEQACFRSGEKVLELGCGDASYWVENRGCLPEGPDKLDVTLTDISAGIVREAEARVAVLPARFSCSAVDAQAIPFPDGSFDSVVANHLLFYCEDLPRVLAEVQRVLKAGGRFLCSTYGAQHMQEVSRLVQSFDDRIVLSAEILYEKFGKENGRELLAPYFRDIEWRSYEDSLLVDRPEPLIAYILSCHGNQNRYIVDHYAEFYTFVKKKTDRGFRVTKDAGLFLARKIGENEKNNKNNA